MGIGRFDPTTGKFDLMLSVRVPITDADLNQWHLGYQRASELLFNATDGKHQLGNVFFTRPPASGIPVGDNEADAWLLNVPGTAQPGGYAAIGTSGAHMTLHSDERLRPLVLVHELGHYIYGLREEYSGLLGAPNRHCLGPANISTHHACIMENTQAGDQFSAATETWTQGQIREFCSINTHNTHEPYNEQEAVNHQSCWRTMSIRYPDLDPIPAEPLAGPTTGADPINWVELDPAQRFVLVIDRSGSMTGDKLTEAKFGADWWADAILLGDSLAVVSFSDTARTDYPLHTINSPSDRTTARTQIDSIYAGGSTSIGDGLRAAYNILNPGPQSATQCIVLLTDGRQNSGEYPSDSLLNLIHARGIRVYTIGIGSDVDPVLLRHIAMLTGGTYYAA